jgi:hypothetical protein
MDEAPRCRATRADGTPCQGPARPSGYCFAHDPDLARRRAEGRRKGGRERSRKAAVLPPDAEDLPLRSLQDVAAMLAATVNQVRRGELDSKVGNTLAVLAGQLMKAIEGGDLEPRLEAIEAELAKQKAREAKR